MKKNIVYASIVYPNRICKVVKCKVNNGTIQYDGNTYDLDKDNFGIYKRYPIYFYDANNPKPKNPIDFRMGPYTPKEYTYAINTKIIGDLLAVLQGKPDINFSMIIGVINTILIILVGVIVFMTSKDLNNLITSIKNQIEIWNGGVN